jgi:tryptophan halogenase
MNICIIGTGASGWIACTMLKKLDFIKKITIIGSSKIPTIGVGESTGLDFAFSVLNDIELKDFVRESDAAVKYGVYYKNWSKKDFIHYFTNDDIEETWENNVSLGNKDFETHIHDLRNNKLWNFIQKNEVSLDYEKYRYTWHFDAGKFITFLKKINLNDDKINFIDDTIVNCKFVGDEIEYVIGENNQKYAADYFVNCCGDNKLNQKVFKEEYISLSPYLLTNKAVVYPLKYTNKKDQFHPYTLAKTMNCGWRWITPTQSRIGTGYVFSDNHISVDQAVNEFINDIGDETIEPFVVNFDPKYNKRTFKTNSCTIGMSNGFLEPLDAPGLTLSIDGIKLLTHILKLKNKNKPYLHALKTSNNNHSFFTKFWCSFILHQYKTSWRNDTQFWMDHKNVKYDFYDKIQELMMTKLTFDKKSYNSMRDVLLSIQGVNYPSMWITTAAKDIQWESKIKQKPIVIDGLDTKTIHHLDYIQRFYD